MQIDSSLRANIRSLAAIHLILKYVHMQINAHTAVYKRKVGALKYTHTHNCTYAHLAKNLLKISSCYQQFPANRHPDAVPHRTTSSWAGARENPLTLSFCSAFACFFCSFQYRALGSLCRLRCATTAIDMYLAYVACHCCLSIDNLFMCNPQWICQNTEIFQVHLHLHFCSSVLLLLHLLLCFYSPFALFIAATWSVAYRWGVYVCVSACICIFTTTSTVISTYAIICCFFSRFVWLLCHQAHPFWCEFVLSCQVWHLDVRFCVCI